MPYRPNKLKAPYSPGYPPGVKIRLHAIAKYLLLTLMISGTLTLFYIFSAGPILRLYRTKDPGTSFKIDRFHYNGTPLAKADLNYLVDREQLLSEMGKNRVGFFFGGKRYLALTSIDPELHKKLISIMKTSHARYIGMVVLNPDDGKILAMTGFDGKAINSGTCTDVCFPAASLFKIISAAALMELTGASPDTPFYFNGEKYTLYKRQLKKTKNRYTSRVSLKEAFAKSINPVFGKIGAHILDKNAIESYAYRFGFNRDIPFDLNLKQSRVSTSSDIYGRAEITSGFNRRTVLTPLHAALIAASVVNGGKLMEPLLVEKIFEGETGPAIYAASPRVVEHSVSPKTAGMLRKMMMETVTSGTLKRFFAGYRRETALKDVLVGGKTGTINSSDNRYRYDWFAGFAQKEATGEKIAAAVIVAHDKYIGRRAGIYAKKIFRAYFYARM